MKYLHQHGPYTWSLDHRLTPEVRAMLTAMASRMPVGGLEQRYRELVEAVLPEFAYLLTTSRDAAEDRLCEYPLHPKVQEFFDKFVGRYGHGSILEATGSPTVYADNLSWYAAYLLFDSPLVVGQENSTRAVTKTDWPMCRESLLLPLEGTDAMVNHARGFASGQLSDLHHRWMEVFVAEKEAWEKRLENPEIRAAYGIKDKEPFRPALDRARWALPGTLSTGVAFASHVRERARAIRDAKAVASKTREAWDVFDELEQAYRAAVPGVGALGLKEAVYGAEQPVPRHLQHRLVLDNEAAVRCYVLANHRDGPEHVWEKDQPIPLWPERPDTNTYADPLYNHLYRVDVQVYCSLAVARDWHRHRTFYPLRLDLVREFSDRFSLDTHYRPISEFGKEEWVPLMIRSTAMFHDFKAAGDSYRAMLCLPFGTRVRLTGSAGLRDAIYTFELRANAVGANFEYEEQARDALRWIANDVHNLGGNRLVEALKLGQWR